MSDWENNFQRLTCHVVLHIYLFPVLFTVKLSNSTDIATVIEKVVLLSSSSVTATITKPSRDSCLKCSRIKGNRTRAVTRDSQTFFLSSFFSTVYFYLQDLEWLSCPILSSCCVVCGGPRATRSSTCHCKSSPSSFHTARSHFQDGMWPKPWDPTITDCDCAVFSDWLESTSSSIQVDTLMEHHVNIRWKRYEMSWFGQKCILNIVTGVLINLWICLRLALLFKHWTF